MPKILDKAVSRIKSRGVPSKSAWPIAVASLQKAGDIRKGTLKVTAKGTKRGEMSRSERQKNPP
jgi:hypothetical protein